MRARRHLTVLGAPRLRVAASLVVALAVMAPGAIVQAHGRPPSFQSIRVDPTDDQHLVAQATWGLATSRDGGASWQWTCAAAYDVDPRMEDPRVRFDAAGTLLLATFNGLHASDDGCEFREGGPTEPAFAGWPLAVDLAPDGSLYVTTTVSFAPDELWRRDADGTWAVIASVGTEQDLIDTLLVAPSEGSRVYLGGGSVRLEDRSRRLAVEVSDDGGRTFRRTPIERLGEEYSVHLLAADPADPDTVWGVVRHFDGEDLPERVIRSTDGGASFSQRLALAQVRSILVRGDEVWVGGALGGLHRSRDRGETFELLSEARVRCLSEVGERVMICGDPTGEETVPPFALAAWDEGAGLEPVLALSEVVQMRACPRCSHVGITCPAWLPDIVLDLELDPEEAGFEGMLPDPDAGTGGPRDAGLPFECGGPPPPASDGCGCAGSGGRNATSPAGAGLVLLSLGWVQRRRRKKTSAAPSRSALA